MEDVEKLLENTYYPDLDSLKAASKGFQPNTSFEPDLEEIQSISYDFESNFIGLNQNNGNSYELLIAVSEGEQGSYTACQAYDNQDTLFWMFKDDKSYWLQESELEEVNQSARSILGLELTRLDTLKEDYQRQKRKYFNQTQN